MNLVAEEWVGSALNLRGLVGKKIASIDFYAPADVVITCDDGVQAQIRIVEPDFDTRDPLDRMIVRVVDGPAHPIVDVAIATTADLDAEVAPA